MSTGPEALVAKGITIRPTNWDIVQDVSLSATRGDITALLGPNGAGKTTLLRGIIGLQPLHKGTVYIGDQNVHQLPPDERAARMAYVPQRSRLAARLSARAVVELGRFPHRGNAVGLNATDHDIVSQALADTDCAYLTDRPFNSCSGGEQARLLLARALATEAPYLLLDEPAANLDIAHALNLFTLLRALADAGRAIVVVMHQLDHALRWADRALVMNRSRAIASGPCRDILTPDLVQDVYRVQMIEGGAPRYDRLAPAHTEAPA
jgi:iron complex transport system ATP-binding protein